MAADLMTILPEYFRPILEYQELMRVFDLTMDDLETDMQQVWKNYYIQTCDEPTLASYERRFGITASPNDTIEYRRQRLLQKYNTIVPFSIHFLRNRLAELFGEDYALTVNSETCKLIVSVTSDRYGAVDLLYDLLWDVVPAHLEIISNQQVNNYISGTINVGDILSSTLIQSI